jgi:hypothetical protein
MAHGTIKGKIKMTRTIDLTPTWCTAARIYCAVLQNPSATEQGKADAERELLRLATAYDESSTTPLERAVENLGGSILYSIGTSTGIGAVMWTRDHAVHPWVCHTYTTNAEGVVDLQTGYYCGTSEEQNRVFERKVQSILHNCQ